MSHNKRAKKLEICCFSLQSCLNAEKGRADRIELCAGMPEGGTTPSYGTVKLATEQVKIPIYVMIRPRGGDFLFSKTEKEVMLEDIQNLKSLKPGGFVIGALNSDGNIDLKTIEEQLKAIDGYPVTFHRAIDMCKDPLQAIETLASLGIENILTSGSYQNAIDGIENLKRFTEAAKGRIAIMAGSGVNAGNILSLAESGVDAFHFSAKKAYPSAMVYRNENINMGGDKSVDEFAIYEADSELIRQAKQLIETV